MTPTNDWHGIIASESNLSQHASRRLRDIGFVVIPGPFIPGNCEQLSQRTTVRSPQPILLISIPVGPGLRDGLMTSSIEGRSLMASTSTHRCSLLVVRSLE